MFDQDQINQLQNLFQSAQSLLVLLPPQPNQDLLASGLALNQVINQAEKTSIIGCSSYNTSFKDIAGLDQIKNTIGNQTLVISFPYKEDTVEHVSYDIDQETNLFQLRIKPKDGATPLATDSINYSHTGASADLVITLGIKSLEELGRLYSDEKDFLDNAKIVNFHLKSQTKFASLNLTPQSATSYSEALTTLIKTLNLTFPQTSAINLYKQILYFTQNFSLPALTPESLEAAAFLLRSGAQTATPPSSSATPQPTTKPSVPSDWESPKIFRSSRIK